MLAVRRGRQRAQADVQLLMNRLNHLKMEEERARKKIDQTNHRANEIKFLKKKNAEKHNELAMIKLENEGTRQNWQNHGAKEAKETRDRRAAAEQKLKDEKTRVAKEIIQKRKANEAEIKAKRSGLQQANMTMRAQIKKRQADLKAERAAKKAAQDAKLALVKQQRMQEEQRLRKEAEDTIKQMEAEEEKLIARLRATQDNQRKAYESLEQAIQLK